MSNTRATHTGGCGSESTSCEARASPRPMNRISSPGRPDDVRESYCDATNSLAGTTDLFAALALGSEPLPLLWGLRPSRILDGEGFTFQGRP
jgi:hypothetical protein